MTTPAPLYPLPPSLAVPPAAHAASHEVGGTDDLYANYGPSIPTLVEALPAWACTSNAGLTSGTIYLTYFTAKRAIALANFLYENRGALTSGLTLARMGLYKVGATTSTLVAQSASTTTMGNTANTETVLPFATAGGYPASYTLIPGQLYAFATILVGSVPGNMPVGGQGMNSLMGTNSRGRLAASSPGNTDLTTSLTNSGLSAVASWFYMAATT